METTSANRSETQAPWATKRAPIHRHLVRRMLTWLAAALLIALIAWGLWPKAIVVETGMVSLAPLTVRVAEEGKTRVRNRYVIAAPVAGLMQRVTFRPGDEIIANTTILTRIEPTAPPLLDPRARAQAEALIAAHVAVEQKASTAVEAARSTLALAESERDRIRKVKTAGILSQSDRETIEATATIKAVELRAAEFSLQISQFELAQARAAIARPLANAADSLLEIRSPVSGRVLKVMQESEMAISPGTAILELGDPHDIEIEAEILSRDAVVIKVGDSVEIEQWGDEAPLKARVRRIEPAAFTKISALGVEEQRVIVLADLIDPPPAAQALGDRYRVEVRIATWHADQVLVVPSGALFREGNVWKTFILKNGKAQLTQVETGHSDGRLTEILKNLEVGDEVLLHPPDTVKNLSPVTKR